jgi:Ni/Fe-hydrogenase subunit HybB-like protein
MYVQSRHRPMGSHMSPLMARSLFAALYVLYPVGCILQLGPDAADGFPIASVIGLVLVAAAFLAFAVLAGSSFQRQAQEPDTKLDERELAQRNRAAYRAFAVFAGLVAVGLLYMNMRLDFDDKVALWAPTTPEHWNALFWGAIILGLTLPAAFLAWDKAPPLED